MEFEFSLRRLLLLTACLGVFALLGGFTPPELGADDLHRGSQTRKAWIYCVILFVGGAVSVSLVEHTMGHMDPTNLRPAYILIGVVLMIASVVWLRSLKSALATSDHQSVSSVNFAAISGKDSA